MFTRLARVLAFAPFAALLFAPSSAHAQDQAWEQQYLQDPKPSPVVSPVDPQRPVAPEPPAPRFGARGEWVLTAAGGGANGAGVSYSTYSASAATFLSASFEAGLDYFVVDHLSIGFDLGASYGDDKGYSSDGSLIRTESTNLSAGVRFGADLPLGSAFSFYPRLTLGLEDVKTTSSVLDAASASSTTGSAYGSSSTSQVGPWLNLFAPLLVHPTSYFFFGVGPRLNHHFATVQGAAAGAGGQSNELGASFVLGGWWGGDAPAAPSTGDDASPSSPAPRERRFGDQGVFVLSNETDAYALSTTYAGTSSSSLGILIQPGFDYFITDQVSLGLDISWSHGKSVGANTDGSQYVTTTTAFGLAPRIGVNVPIGPWVSWYPRAEIGAGPESYNETSNGAQNNESSTRVWVELESPFLLHPVRHFFVGAGPYVSQELSNVDQNGVSNQQTQIGANVLVGGWL